MMEKKYPILIPAKNISTRLPNKNKKLLPYTTRWLGEDRNRAILLSDSLDLLEFGIDLGISGQLITNQLGEIPTMLDWIEKEEYLGDWIIHLPLPQPLRYSNLLLDLDNFKNPENFDFITSYTWLPKRPIFEIDEDGKFITESSERMGKLCSKSRVLDGAIYLIKTSWIKECCKFDNWNSKFWSGKIGLVENNVPILDIDWESDLDMFNNILNTVKIIK